MDTVLVSGVSDPSQITLSSSPVAPVPNVTGAETTCHRYPYRDSWTLRVASGQITTKFEIAILLLALSRRHTRSIFSTVVYRSHDVVINFFCCHYSPNTDAVDIALDHGACFLFNGLNSLPVHHFLWNISLRECLFKLTIVYFRTLICSSLSWHIGKLVSKHNVPNPLIFVHSYCFFVH